MRLIRQVLTRKVHRDHFDEDDHGPTKINNTIKSLEHS